MIKPKDLIIFLYVETVIQVALMAPCEVSPCEPIRADLCTNLDNNYNQTKFPTKRFISQRDALLQFNSYSALVRSNCSAKLARFLCSYYFPPCLSCDDQFELDPCQSLCEEVKEECEPVLKDYNHTWNFNCSKLPAKQPCIEPPTPEPTSNPIAPSIDDMCHSINNSVCSSLHPSYKTFFPNDNFNSQEAAHLHFQSFASVVNHNCSDQLKFLLCSSHYPVCVPDVQDNTKVDILYPCKNVCNTVRRNCEQLLLDNNATWPELLNCSTFPSKSDGLCLDSTTFYTNITATTTEIPTSKPTSNSIDKCEPIDPRVHSICGVLDKDYNWTHFPHNNFSTQDDAYAEFETHLETIKSNCSAELLAFLCYHYFPSCSPDDQAESKVPCRSVCRKARTGCEKCLEKGWPKNFNCEKNYLVNKKCITLKDINKYRSTFVSKPCKSAQNI